MSNIIGALRRRWYVVLACLIVAPGVAVGIAASKSKSYSAKAEILFRESHFDQELFGASAIPAPDPTRQAATNIKLVDVGDVSQKVATALNVSAESVREAISISPEGEADIASVTADWGDPRFAARVADSYIEQFIALRRESERRQVRTAQRVIEGQVNRMTTIERSSASGQALRERANQLKVLAGVQNGDAELVSSAGVPGSPSSPSPKRDAILGVVLGLILGIGLALLIDRGDRRLRGVEAVSRGLQTAVLACVPKPRKRRKRNAGVLEPRTADVFRAVHANLRFSELDGELRSVMLTSPADTDGRSAVARQLAAAAADGGSRVLLIEADLRSPGGAPGLAEVLVQAASLDDVMTTFPLGAGFMDLLETGQAAGSPIGLLSSSAMASLLEQCQLSYDLVIVDAPPLGAVPDAIPLAKSVSGVLVVVRDGTHSDRKLAALHSELERLRLPVLGGILTGAKASSERYAAPSGGFVTSVEV